MEQGCTSVTEYTKEFEKLFIVCDFNKKEELKFNKFAKDRI